MDLEITYKDILQHLDLLSEELTIIRQLEDKTYQLTETSVLDAMQALDLNECLDYLTTLERRVKKRMSFLESLVTDFKENSKQNKNILDSLLFNDYYE